MTFHSCCSFLVPAAHRSAALCDSCATRKHNCLERERGSKPLCHFAFQEGYGPPRLRRAVAAPLNQLHPWRQWPVQGKSGKVFQHFEFIVCIGGQTGSAYVLPLLAGWYKFFFPCPLSFTFHVLSKLPSYLMMFLDIWTRNCKSQKHWNIIETPSKHHFNIYQNQNTYFKPSLYVHWLTWCCQA